MMPIRSCLLQSSVLQQAPHLVKSYALRSLAASGVRFRSSPSHGEKDPELVRSRLLDLLEQETDRALEGSATPDYYEQLQMKLQQDVNRLAAMAKNSSRYQSSLFSEGDRAMVKKHHYLELLKQETDKALMGNATSDYLEQVESHIQQDHLAEEIRHISHLPKEHCHLPKQT